MFTREILNGLLATAVVLMFSLACSFASPPKEELKAPTQKEIITLMIKNLKHCQEWNFDETKWNHFPECRIIES
jgi:hypothetical protein